MSIKKIKPKSPDPYLSKTKGDNTLARIAHVNQLVDQINATSLVGPQGAQGVQGPIGPQGVPGPVGPAGLNWQGAWTSGTSYVADDAVGYGGASWFCILATSGTTAPDVDTTHWALLASQGATGATGATGAQGPQGAQGIQGPAGGGSYLVYSALVKYTAGNPTATVLENTLGVTITWATSLGNTTATASSSAFTVNKTTITANNYTGPIGYTVYANIGARISDTVISLQSIEISTSTQAAAFNRPFLVEIRVYP